MPPEQSLIATVPPSKTRIKVPVELSMTTTDLRDALFSLTEIVPDTIHITLPSGVNIPPSEPPKLLSAIPLNAGDAITVSSTPPALTLDALAAALDSIDSAPRATGNPAAGSHSNNARIARSVGSATTSGAGTDAGHAYLRRIQAYYDAVIEYNDAELQAKARNVMPLADMRAEADAAVAKAFANGGAGLDLCPDAALLRALLKWFKDTFFKWVDALPCWACSEKCQVVGHVEPSAEERRWRANVVELHGCKACGAQVRFGRFNDAAKLLETRRGRCGEWAQAFGLLCVAAGLVMRCVYDATDHVWTEIWSRRERRWIHADSCENIMDERLLYERGWGKKLAYCVAVGAGSVVDVTRRYTEKYSEVLSRRTIVNEEWLRTAIERLNREVGDVVPAAERAAARERGELERAELSAMGGVALSGEQLPGRQSGTKEWVEARGEDGGK